MAPIAKLPLAGGGETAGAVDDEAALPAATPALYAEDVLALPAA